MPRTSQQIIRQHITRIRPKSGQKGAKRADKADTSSGTERNGPPASERAGERRRREGGDKQAGKGRRTKKKGRKKTGKDGEGRTERQNGTAGRRNRTKGPNEESRRIAMPSPAPAAEKRPAPGRYFSGLLHSDCKSFSIFVPSK